MRIRWLKLLTALLMAALTAVLPICAIAQEGAHPTAVQQQNEGDAVPEEPPAEDRDAGEGEIAGEGENLVEESAAGESEGGEDARQDTLTGQEDVPAETLGAALAKLKTGGHEAYMKGISGGLFRPDAAITRAEVAQVIYSLLEKKPENTSADFSDVKKGNWAYPAVAAMNTLGVMTGSGGNFRPAAEITRGEFVTVLVRCFELPRGECTFPDVDKDYWAYDAIAAVQQKGWIKGYSDGRFAPDDPMTRCQVAKIMNSALERRDSGFAADSSKQEFLDVPRSHWAFKEIAEAADPVDVPSPSPSPEPPEPSGLKVGDVMRVDSDDGLNIRRSPVSGEVIVAVPDGTLLTITNVNNPAWPGVKTPSGVTGYASAEYMKPYNGGTPQSGTLSATSLSMRQYMSARLDATASSNVGAMRWTSSNANVAKVGYTINYGSTKQSAIVYAGSPGTAVLTYSDGAGNKKGTCTVTVTAAEPVRFAYPSESIVKTGADFDLVAITDNSRDQVRFDIVSGPDKGSYTAASYTAESHASGHGLPTNSTRVFKKSLKLGKAGTYTLRAYSGKGGSFSDEYKTFTVVVKDNFTYNTVSGEARTISSKGMAVIRDFEGVVHEIADDAMAPGNPTVGCGYVVSRANETFYNNMTDTECYAMLEKTAKDGPYSKAVESFRKKHNIRMSQGQFDALVSWVYNIGTGYLSQGESDAADMILNMVVPPAVSVSKPASGAINTSSSTNPAVLYASTSTTSAKLATIPLGTGVKITEVKRIRSAKVQQVWYKTSYGGKTGWVGSGYVKLSGSHQVDLSYADSTSLATELMLWHMAGSTIYPGLVYRRLFECKIFFFGNYDEGKPMGYETPNYRKNTYGFVYPDRIKDYDRR